VLNLVLTMAMLAVPPEVLGGGDASQAYEANRDVMMRLLAEYYIGPTFAAIASLVFALLLLSAVNTAVTDLVSIQFMMARDRELTPLLAGLNHWGIPVLPLVLGTLVPLATVLLVPDVSHLADLYAIGVVGAVTINLGSCATNFGIELGRIERLAMRALAALLAVIWCSIALDEPHALLFAGGIVALELAGRWLSRNRTRVRQWLYEPVPMPYSYDAETSALASTAPVIGPAAAPSKPTIGAPVLGPHVAPTARLMVTTRGNPRLVAFALEQARLLQGELRVLFVRHIAVPTLGSSHAADGGTDRDAQLLFADVRR
jgi:hypothetical protein